jgi:hypothetical protein
MIFLPLDIPPIPNKQHIVDNFSGETRIVGKDIFDESKRVIFYKWQKQQLLENNKWSKLALNKYADLVEWIDKYFPFETKLAVPLLRSMDNVGPHTDNEFTSVKKKYGKDEWALIKHTGEYVKTPQYISMKLPQYLLDHQLANEPIGYRFIVSGSRDSLYMCDQVDNQKKIFCSVPENTDAYVMNHCTQPHGLDIRPDIDDERLVGFIYGIVNVKQHQELLEKSKNKYSKQVITENELRV